MREKAKQTTFLLLKIAVALGILTWLVRNESLDLRVLLQLGRIEYLPLFIGLPLLNLCLNHYRWLFLLNAQGLHVRYWSSLPLSFIGLFFNFALPGGVGGDVVKGYYLLRDQPGRKLDATVTVLLDRILGVFSMLLLSAFVLATHMEVMDSSVQMKTLASMIFMCAGGGALFCLFVFTDYFDRLGLSLDKLPKWKFLSLAHKLHTTVLSFRESRFVLAKCIVTSWVSHLAAVAFIALVAHVTSPDAVPWQAFFFVVPLGFIAMALPISPAGVGVGQYAFLFLFKLYTGQESQVGPNAITAFQASQLCLSLLGAYFFLRKRKEITASSTVMAETA